MSSLVQLDNSDPYRQPCPGCGHKLLLHHIPLEDSDTNTANIGCMGDGWRCGCSYTDDHTLQEIYSKGHDYD